MITRWINIALLLVAVSQLSACGKLFGDVRNDFNDQQFERPAYGGAWPEGGVLQQEEDNLKKHSYGTIGHNDRTIAAATKSYYHDKEFDEYDDRSRAIADRAEDEVAAIRDRPKSLYQNSIYKQGERATKKDFLDEDQAEGSLWASHGQTNYYFTKNKIRSVGDLISVTLEKDFVRDSQSEFVRSLSPQEREYELQIAQEQLKAEALAKMQKSKPTGAAAAKPKDGEEEVPEAPSVRQAGLSDIKSAEIFELKEGEKIMAEVLERYPNGNYKIRGVKRVPYRGGFRNLTMIGIAKGTAVSDKDELTTGNLYEYRMEVYQ